MRVLLASDGSDEARRATRWLRDLPLPSDTKICVLTVATLTRPPRDGQSMKQLRHDVVAAARRAATTAAAMLRPRWSKAEVVVVLGDPAVEIVHIAEQTPIDMIVLGARGLTRRERWFVGSTSLTVARYAPCPVVVVRGRGRTGRVRRVLVAVDGSETARAALRFVRIVHRPEDAHVGLLHVLPAPTASGGRRRRRSAANREPGLDPRPADADAVLADAAAVLGETGRPVEQLVSEGDPAREIVRIAEDRDVDLVVVGARGLGTLERLLLGSVSETVLHHAARPVLIVRER
jgi:nucleotide-binding universal stress UspA family protein